MLRTAPSIPQGSVTGRGRACTFQSFPQYLQHLSPSRDYIWGTDLPCRRSPSPSSPVHGSPCFDQRQVGSEIRSWESLNISQMLDLCTRGSANDEHRPQTHAKSHRPPAAPSHGYLGSLKSLTQPPHGRLGCWGAGEGNGSPQLPPGPGAAPRPQRDPPLCRDLGKGGMWKKDIPTWAKAMGIKPSSLSPACRGGGNVSSAPRRLNGLLKNPFVLDPFFFPKLAGPAPRGNL